MDIEKELLKEHSKAQAKRIADHIGYDSGRFRALMELFLRGEYRVAQRSAMAVGIVADRCPELIRPYLAEMVDNLDRPVHDAVKRNTVRLLQNIDIPEPLWGKVWDICFRQFSDPAEPVAVRVFSMTVLYNLCQKLPELKHELRIVLEDQLPYGSAGFVSRGRKILKKLQG